MFQTEVWLNPLDPFQPDNGPCSSEDTLGFMCTPGVPSDPVSIKERYREITAVQPAFFAPPAETRLLQQLVWPLRHAKACYIVGNYLGTIALAGIVGEMAALLMFDLVEATVAEKPMAKSIQAQLFGRDFENLGQERRIEILKAFGALKPEVAEAYGRIRGTRKKHLHLAQLTDSVKLAVDARTMFRDAVAVVADAIGQNIQDGKLVFTPQMARYLERAGKVARTQDADEPTAPSEE